MSFTRSVRLAELVAHAECGVATGRTLLSCALRRCFTRGRLSATYSQLIFLNLHGNRKTFCIFSIKNVRKIKFLYSLNEELFLIQ